MADSDEEHDKRNIREKFRPERSDYERRSDDRRGREPWEDRFSASSFCVLMLHFSNCTVVIFNSFNELELVLIVFSKLYILKQVTLTFDLDLQCFDTVSLTLLESTCFTHPHHGLSSSLTTTFMDYYPDRLTRLGGRKGIRPVKNGGMMEVGTCWSGWSGAQPDGRCLPLLVFPFTRKSRGFLLAPAHPGGPGKSAVKWWLLLL